MPAKESKKEEPLGWERNRQSGVRGGRRQCFRKDVMPALSTATSESSQMWTRRKPLGSATVDIVGGFNKKGSGNPESTNNQMA